MRKINRIIIHCSDSNWGDAEEIKRWHTMLPPKGNGWSDIGYHYVITNGYPSYKNWTSKDFDEHMDGIITLGRPIETPGAHAAGYNKDSIGICLVGINDFTPSQMDILKELVLKLMQQYKVSVDNVIGHYECSTAHGKTCPNFDMLQFRFDLK